MLALYIIGGVLLLFVVLLACPITVQFAYENKFFIKIKYLFFSFEIPKDIRKKDKKEKPQKNKSRLNLEKFREKHGTADTIKEVCDIIKVLFSRLKWLVSKLYFKKLFVDIKVCGENAAYTAVEYGGVCAAVYPVMGFISANARTDIKAVNISPDFTEGNETAVTVSGKVKCRAVYAVITLISIIKVLTEREIIKTKQQPKKPGRVHSNGRKQH